MKHVCLFCEKSHFSKDCHVAQKMSKDERNEKLRKKGACFVCFRSGHISKTCKASVKCPICSRRHELLMCPQNPRNIKDEQKKEKGVVMTQSNLNFTSEVILRTMMVRLANPSTLKKKTVRVLVDCGSQRSYVLQKTAQDLGLMPVQMVTINHQLFGGAEVSDSQHSVFDVQRESIIGDFVKGVRVMDQATICGSLPRVSKGSWMTDLKKFGIFLNDLDARNPVEIEFLIGADILGDFLTGNVQKLKNGLTAIETRLGWAVMGEIENLEVHKEISMNVLSMTISSSTISQLWTLETLGIRDPVEKKSEEEREREALEYFQKTVTRNTGGRYSVSLPWIGGSQALPSNRSVALRRLETTTRKLCSVDKFLKYDKVFRDWELENIISVVNDPKRDFDNCSGYFLPHRAVFKDSLTTPVRPVFDASCKSGRHPSLNECLQKGPNLLELIPSILLRFRMGRIGVTADIRKAFLMIKVHETDRDHLRFLWWEDSDRKRVRIYRHNRVVFGMNCSPFLLGAVILHHLNQHRSENPKVVEKIVKSLYVDNLVTAVANDTEFQVLKRISTALMSTARMDLRQWEKSGDCDEQSVTSVLGIKWNKKFDSLFCDMISHEIPLKITKRNILSHLQKVYDPLGLWSPVTIVPKVLLQRAWNEGKKWDDEVNEEIENDFLTWSFELSSTMEKVRVPRNFTEEVGTNISKLQIHTFGDASKKAYATVVFVRVVTSEGVKVHFLQAKSRVAPLKCVSIPRLELLACVISSRLTVAVKEALQLHDVPTYFWTDSSTALSWIQRSDEWGTFVGNRVKEVCQLTRVEDWRHIPGVHNPADLPSRGVLPVKFFESRWWEGPSWLLLEENEWPRADVGVDEDAVNQERKKNITTLVVSSTFPSWYIRKNRYVSNLRVFCFVFRFLDYTRKIRVQEPSTCVTAEELDRTEQKLIKSVQGDLFHSKSDVIEGLKVELDSDGILRVKTKVTHREDSDMFIRPVLLPHSHPLVDLIIQETHEVNSHGGAQLVMAKLREKFWIVKGRRAVKKVIRRCTKCRRYDGKSEKPESCALPEPRVRDGCAFEVTGIDLAGPLTLKNKHKVYIVLFTCAVYRCVHLELAESLSTDDFLLCFIRFCKRKQRPSIIYTDNGSNFVGAVNLFQTIDWGKVQEDTQVFRIKWVFNPPSAPWWGGWWERLIKTVKSLLRRMLGFAKLNYVQLETALCEVESSVNHRPLTYVTEDQQDLVPLTPAMFIYNLPNCEVPESQVVNLSTMTEKKKNLEKLMTEIKERFRVEYLGQLVQRGKGKTTRPLEVGEVVLIETDNQKRIAWAMARIVELMPGKDGVVRVARLKTKNGFLIRPIQRLVPLEVRSGDLLTIQEGRLKRREHTEVIGSEIETDSENIKTKADVEEPVRTSSGRLVKKPERFNI